MKFSDIKNSVKTYAVDIIACVIVYAAIIILFACRTSGSTGIQADDGHAPAEYAEPTDTVNPNMTSVVFSDYATKTFKFSYEASAYQDKGISDIDKHVRLYTYLSITNTAAKYPSTVNIDAFKAEVYNDLRIRCAEDSIIVTNFELSEIH